MSKDSFVSYRTQVYQSLEWTFRGSGGGITYGPWRPNIDVYETEDAVVVAMELAGVAPGSVEVLVEGSRLVVRGVRSPALRSGARRIHRIEIRRGGFQVSVDLPKAVDQDSAEAEANEGLLEVVLPLTRPRTMQVTSATPDGEIHDDR